MAENETKDTKAAGAAAGSETKAEAAAETAKPVSPAGPAGAAVSAAPAAAPAASSAQGASQAERRPPSGERRPYYRDSRGGPGGSAGPRDSRYGGPRRGPGGPGGGGYGSDESGGRRRRFSHRKMCPLCANKVKYLDYKDVGTLRVFVSERGKIRPRRMTGMCAGHQRELTAAIKRARNIALLPFKI